MRMYLAVAVLVLAFVAYSEAQEQTIEEKLSKIGSQMSEIGTSLAEKAKSTFHELHNSPFAENARNWLQEQITQLKEKVKGIGQ